MNITLGNEKSGVGSPVSMFVIKKGILNKYRWDQSSLLWTSGKIVLYIQYNFY